MRSLLPSVFGVRVCMCAHMCELYSSSDIIRFIFLWLHSRGHYTLNPSQNVWLQIVIFFGNVFIYFCCYSSDNEFYWPLLSHLLHCYIGSLPVSFVYFAYFWINWAFLDHLRKASFPWGIRLEQNFILGAFSFPLRWKLWLICSHISPGFWNKAVSYGACFSSLA